MDVSPPEFESESILRPRQEIRYQQKVLRAPDGVELFPLELRDGVLWSEICFLFMWQSELSGN